MTFKEFFLEKRNGPDHHSTKHLVGGHISNDASLSSIAKVHKKEVDPNLIAAKNGGIRKITPDELKDTYGITNLNDPRLLTTGLVPNGKNPNVVIIKNKFGFFIKRK